MKAGVTYSDLGLKLARNYKLQRLREQPPVIPQKWGPSKRLGKPLRWRRCEFCNEWYEARLNTNRRACGKRKCDAQRVAENQHIRRPHIQYAHDKYVAKMRNDPEYLQKRREYNYAYYRRDIEKSREYYRNNYYKHIEHNKAYQRAYYYSHQEQIKAYRKSPARAETVRKYNEKNKDKVRERNRESHRKAKLRNPEELRAKKRAYYQKYKDKINARRRKCTTR